MINGIFHAHSGLRYLVLLAALVGAIVLSRRDTADPAGGSPGVPAPAGPAPGRPTEATDDAPADASATGKERS